MIVEQLLIFVCKISKADLILSKLRKKILNILKYLAFTSLGITMFWLVYRNQDFTRIFNTLKNDVNYSWVFLSLFLGLLSHISRTLRWKIALEPLGEKPKTSNTFITVMAAYFMNLLLPRMGEFVRCGLLSKYEKIPFPKLFGTVITERIIDVIMLLILLLLVTILEFDVLVSFSKQNPEVLQNAVSIIKSPILWGLIFFLIAFTVFYFKRNSKKNRVNKIEKIFNDFIEGIKSILSMKRYKEYIAHSIFIWLMYFLMLYCVFFSLKFTSNLGPIAALTTFVMGTLAMLAPVQAGIGAWHFMVEKALFLYGVESADGKIFALLAHTSTNALIIIVGVICIIILPILNRNYIPKKDKLEL